MKVIEQAVRFPVTITVGVLLLSLFGILALLDLPVQLTPDISEPQVTVSTIWPGASPQEVEREIVDKQEEQLKSLEGLVRMQSSSQDSHGTVTLVFRVGADIDAALLKVSNRLQQVRSYPADVDRPVIYSTNPDSSAMAWFSLEPINAATYQGDITELYDFADDFIKPEFERIPGVAAANVYGGRERELHVIVDPARLAARRVTINELGAALDRENRNYSGGDFSEGKRRYVVRTVGEYLSPDDVAQVVVAVRDGTPVYVRDVARVELGFQKVTARVFQQGQPTMVLNAVRETGANVLDAMAGLKAAADQLDRELLASRGLHLVQVYDETEYIVEAMDLVRSSLVIGAILAVIVLLLFLRSLTSTLVIATAIPISIIGTFLMMSWFGRTLNVVSLAGLAFAVGMAVDNSIVVLENIYRHRQMGKSLNLAAVDGAKEVWGAVLASTLTTIAVFVPIVFIEEEAGQLFADIAVAISCAVGLSLIVSITVIPSMSAKVLHAVEHDHHRHGVHDLWGAIRLADAFVAFVKNTVSWILDGTLRRVTTVVVLTAASIGLSVLLMPKTEYLPVGNNNFMFGVMLPPPGYNIAEMTKVHDVYQRQLQPLWAHPAGSVEAEKLPGGGIKAFFFVALPNFGFMGASSNDGQRVRELLPEFGKLTFQVPGAIAVMTQSSIFQQSTGAGRNIDVVLSGPDLNRLIAVGGQVYGQVMQKLPGAQARPIPSLDLGNPEVRVVTDRLRAAELGVSNRELGFAVSALIDGAKASEYRYEGREVDLTVMAEPGPSHRTHLIEQMPIATPAGELVTLGSVANVVETTGPTQIDHRERQRSITIQVTPAEQMPLEAAMDVINNDIVQPLRASGQITGLERVTLAGSADKLTETFRVLRFDFILALVITYLLMAALFESFLYPFVIMFSVPLAALGGFLGLSALNRFLAYQALDVLTMLGFIILVGTVVNNAILIVHQALNHMREEGKSAREAIVESTGTRIRPIFMTVATTVFGMLPLVLAPGSGSELYRGLGAVVVGGLVVSTIFTLFLVPALFSLTLDVQAAIMSRARSVLRPTSDS